MLGGLQPPSRLKGSCDQHGFWELWVSCSKILPCTKGLTLSSSLRYTVSWQRWERRYRPQVQSCDPKVAWTTCAKDTNRVRVMFQGCWSVSRKICNPFKLVPVGFFPLCCQKFSCPGGFLSLQIHCSAWCTLNVKHAHSATTEILQIIDNWKKCD